MMARSRGRSAAIVKAATEIDFSKRPLDWFQYQPRKVSVILAMRSALRVLPLIDGKRERPDSAARVTLPALRACFVVWGLVKYPSWRNRLQRAVRGAAAAAQTAASRADADIPAADVHYADVPAAHAAVAHAEAHANAMHAAAHAAHAVYVQAYADAARAANFRAAAAYGGLAPWASGWTGGVNVLTAADAAARADAVAIEQKRAVAEIVATPLWPGEIPNPIVEFWNSLRYLLLRDKSNSFDPWVQWYERVRDGRPSFGEAFDLAVASLTDEQWNEEPVPAAVNRRITALLAEHTSPEPIPPQGPGPHFTLGPDLRIALAPPAEIDAGGNHLAGIRQLLPVVRQAAADLAGNLNPNTQPEISRTLKDYRAAIAGEPETIAWGMVFGLGVRLDNAATAARRQIEDRLRPPLEDAAQEALDSLLTLHVPLIHASAEGRGLLSLADESRLTPEQRVALRLDAEFILRSLEAAPDAIDDAATNAVEAAVEAAGEGPHPERGVAYWFGTVRNIAVILVPAAVLATAGAAAGASFGAAIGGIAGAAAGAVGTAALRESERVKLAAKALGAGYDRLLERGDQAMVEGLRRLTPFRNLVIALEEPLRRYAETTQSRWMIRYIDFIVRNDGDRK